MKQIFSIFTLLLVFAWTSSCASSSAAYSYVAPAPVEGGSSVWKITKDGNTLLLAGSIHVLRETDFPLPDVFDLAFSQSAALVLEADIAEMEDPYVVQYLMSKMLLSDGQTLLSMLDLNTYRMLAAKLNEYGLPVEAVINIKPSMVIAMLTILQIEKYGFTQEGIDFYYMEKAKNTNKPVLFLESVETQMNALVSMGEGYENDFVLYSLQDLDNTETWLSLIIEDWRKGEAASTEESLAAMKSEPLVYKPLITDRHTAWMPQITKYLNSGSTYFVIIGLAHIHGPDGLLRYLRDLGCTIEQFL